MTGFTNKRVLVTGASGGIGRATAIELAMGGARVAVHGFRNIEATKQTAELVRMSASVVHESPVVTGDLSDPKTAHQVVNSAVESLGGIDILINNAGDLVERRALADMDVEFFNRVIGA
ncbi:MAG: SDR family NAD(P)-dependent oxidoreductase, partial [Myxococcota bacterium]